jgi:hypothetical protein
MLERAQIALSSDASLTSAGWKNKAGWLGLPDVFEVQVCAVDTAGSVAVNALVTAYGRDHIGVIERRIGDALEKARITAAGQAAAGRLSVSIDRPSPHMLTEAERADPDMALASMLGDEWVAHLLVDSQPAASLAFNDSECLATNSPSAEGALRRSYSYAAGLILLIVSAAWAWRRAPSAKEANNQLGKPE